jgi:LacI family transcriptional regulator, galactose operon repressor
VTTIADVAKRAGVSVATAGRVLSGQGYAGKAARQRVLEAAEELGYVPNRIASSLRLRRTKMLGLLIADVENSFYSVIARNVESIAKDSGYHVILCNSSDDPSEEREYLKLLEEIRVDGLIITPTPRNRRSLERLKYQDIVIVQIDRQVDRLNADAILVDNERDAASAVSHLIAAGHTQIGILTGPLDVTTAKLRLAGYRRAMEEHGIPVQPELVRAGSFRRDDAIKEAYGLIAMERPPTAIFAANNILAEAALVALAEMGLKVPRDMSLVAFDDTPWMSMLKPPITTVRQPVADMARSATELLLRRLRGGPAEPATVLFNAELVVRGSVASLPKQGRALS